MASVGIDTDRSPDLFGQLLHLPQVAIECEAIHRVAFLYMKQNEFAIKSGGYSYAAILSMIDQGIEKGSEYSCEQGFIHIHRQFLRNIVHNEAIFPCGKRNQSRGYAIHHQVKRYMIGGLVFHMCCLCVDSKQFGFS
jgi:hypothetical protein